jgi:hypothetical protein
MNSSVLMSYLYCCGSTAGVREPTGVKISISLAWDLSRTDKHYSAAQEAPCYYAELDNINRHTTSNESG